MFFLKLFGFKRYASLIDQIITAVEDLATGQSAPFDAKIKAGGELIEVQGTITVTKRVKQ